MSKYSTSFGASRFTSYKYRSSRDEDFLVKLFGVSVLVVIAMYIYLFWSGQFGKTWLVAHSTFPLYVTFGVVAAWGCYWWWQNEQFTTPELCFYLGFSVFAVIPTVCIGFLWLTDLGDTEVWNGRAEKVEWTESYYTESRDKDGKVTTTHHSATYIVYTSNSGESVYIDSSTWDNYVAHWGGADRVNSRRILLADGEDFFGSNHNGIPEVHTIDWEGDLKSRVPTSVEHRYANFLKASDSVEKIQGVMNGWKQYLVEYPRVQDGHFGSVYFTRVLQVGASVPGDFSEAVQRTLTDALCTLGSQKECNIIVYVVGTSDMGVFPALEEKWVMGKKNDIVVCIGYTEDKIQFCRVMAWSKHKLFMEKLEGAVRDLGTLSGKGRDLANVIVKQVTAPGDAGYLRKPMAELSYLAAEVKMPVWAYLLVSFWGCLVMVPTIMLVKD